MLAQLRELVDERTVLLPLTVEQYHQMLATGILVGGDPYELLDGHIFHKDRSAAGEDPMSVGHEHTWVVQKLNRLNPKLEKLGCHMRTQVPVTLPPYDEPEPDGSVAFGTEDDYVGRHPGAADVTCVIEVADSSLRRDRTTKLRIYANSGIAQYVIINLPDRIIEVYTHPRKGRGRYGPAVTLGPADTLALPTAKGKTLAVRVRDLLPRG